MLNSETIFLGIDPTSGRNTFTYAALDKDLGLRTLADADLGNLMDYIRGFEQVVLAINAPSGINRGLVRQKMKREVGGSHKIRGADMRLAEFELRERGISVSGTPGNIGMCSGWVQSGFDLYQNLLQSGFRKYPQNDRSLQVLETHPHACFTVMAGCLPLPKPSLEGKLQRQLLLHDHGVQIRDPMDFFEEVTRYKMAQGIWPTELLYLPEQLDALVAGYSAWMAINKPDQISMVGDEREGMIFLPESSLKDKYS